LQQFVKEKLFLTKISHPWKMKIYPEGIYYATSLAKSIPFVVCDYFPDRLDWKIRNKKLKHSEKLIYITHLLSAIDFLEKRFPKIVRRDIKPQNIFIKGYTCVLADFGLMKTLADTSPEDQEEIFKKKQRCWNAKYYRTPDLVKYAKRKEVYQQLPICFNLVWLQLR
jgi:eukaryotic-like serine/threonine-protein kinase